MQNRLTQLILTVIVLGSFGCTTAYKRLYDGPSRDRAEVAVLNVQWNLLGDSARIETIDGNAVEKGRAFALNIKKAELLPGTHTLEVSYFNGGARSINSISLAFTCEAGGVYELRVAPVDEGLGGQVVVAAGGRGHWTAWIVDAKTKKIMAGTPRTTALRWYEK